MIRDYSEEVYQRLIKQIEEIKNETINPVTDFLGDFFKYICKFCNFIDKQEIENYQKEVMDMTNMKKNDVKKIFKKVEQVNIEYSKNFEELNKSQQKYALKLQMLGEMISPNFNMESADTIRKRCQTLNKEIKDSEKKLAEIYDKELDKALKREGFDALKNTVGGVVDMATTVFTLPHDLIDAYLTGGPVKMNQELASETWGLINSVFDVGSNLGALAAVGLGVTVASGRGKERMLTEAEKYEGVEGLADALKAEYGNNRFTSAVSVVSDKIENVDTVTGLWSDGKSFFTEGKGILPESNEVDYLDYKDLQNNLKKQYDTYDEIFDLQLYYSKYARQATNASALKHMYSYAEIIFDVNEEGGIAESLLNNMLGESKLLKDLKQIMNFDETFHIKSGN